jgi:hypothetical protein
MSIRKSRIRSPRYHHTMASERERSPGRFATLALAVGYLVAFCSWLPIPRTLVASITRSRHRREAIILVVLVIATVFVVELLIPT